MVLYYSTFLNLFNYTTLWFGHFSHFGTSLMEVTGTAKPTSLKPRGIHYNRKMFYSTGPDMNEFDIFLALRQCPL
jgi:hypothetical protein